MEVSEIVMLHSGMEILSAILGIFNGRIIRPGSANWTTIKKTLQNLNIFSSAAVWFPLEKLDSMSTGRNILQKNLSDLSDTERARQKRRLPVMDIKVVKSTACNLLWIILR